MCQSILNEKLIMNREHCLIEFESEQKSCNGIIYLLVLLSISISGCVPLIAGGMLYSSVKSNQEKKEFLNNFNMTNIERSNMGLEPLDLCTEKYNFDKYWAMEDPNCEEVVKRLDPDPDFTSREAEELDKLGTR